MKDQDSTALLLLPLGLLCFWIYNLYVSFSRIEKILLLFVATLFLSLVSIFIFYFYSPWSKKNRKRLVQIKEIPKELLIASSHSVSMGVDDDLDEKVYLSDQIRTRHVHILGATGSGKTESVILNFLKQDVARGLGTIILDAKGDNSFLNELNSWVPSERLKVFDLLDENSLGYDPISAGSLLEAAQRLFSSLTWSEEYYKSKALSSLQRIFQVYSELNDKNPNLLEVSKILESPDSYSSFVNSPDFPQALAIKEFQDLSGLRDQVRSLTLGHLAKILSPTTNAGIHLYEADNGAVIYFRLQSLMSPQIVSTVGKLVINHLNFFSWNRTQRNCQ